MFQNIGSMFQMQKKCFRRKKVIWNTFFFCIWNILSMFWNCFLPQRQKKWVGGSAWKQPYKLQADITCRTTGDGGSWFGRRWKWLFGCFWHCCGLHDECQYFCWCGRNEGWVIMEVYDQGLILSSFLGYVQANTSGRLAHRYGAKRVFAFSIMIPALLTLLFPLACEFLRLALTISSNRTGWSPTFPCCFNSL